MGLAVVGIGASFGEGMAIGFAFAEKWAGRKIGSFGVSGNGVLSDITIFPGNGCAHGGSHRHWAERVVGYEDGIGLDSLGGRCRAGILGRCSRGSSSLYINGSTDSYDNDQNSDNDGCTHKRWGTLVRESP